MFDRFSEFLDGTVIRIGNDTVGIGRDIQEQIAAPFFADLILMKRGCEITVTDKRVYGRAAFGKQIDLPINQVSSVGTCYGQGVFAATSSGIIRFWLLDNQMEVYHAMSALLRDKQTAVVQPTVVASSGDADELKKFKMLLDDGVITQEEFDAKKKQILGL